jgi:glycosyltransferase involved in cell wall biosynthesis
MISIIVPVYNVSRVVKDCINSILSQTYQNIELILVNDGSTDCSLQICEAYAIKDSRIVIINKRNEGVDRARFEGLKIAKGEFVSFVDSDDWLEKDTLRVMYECMLKFEVDYVEVGMQRVMDKLKIIKKKSISPFLGLIKQPELFDEYWISFFGYNILKVNVWGKLYRRSCLDRANLNPSGLKMGEDLYFNMMLFPYLRSIYISDYIGYNYRYGGMTSKYNPSLYPDLKKLYYKKKELVKEYEYNKANDFIRYEMVNVLKSDVRQKILYRHGVKEEIITQLRNELTDSIWDDINDINNKDYLLQTIPRAIIYKDAETIYDTCLIDVKRLLFKLKLKKMASCFLQYI